MVSCLTLINSTHVLARQEGGLNHTLCGLGIAVADTQPGLLAQTPASATCLRCQNMLCIEAASQAAQERAPDARTLVERLVDRLNTNDPSRMEETLGGSLLAALSPQRMSRPAAPKAHSTAARRAEVTQ
jgi:hypothetical protein